MHVYNVFYFVHIRVDIVMLECKNEPPGTSNEPPFLIHLTNSILHVYNVFYIVRIRVDKVNMVMLECKIIK